MSESEQREYELVYILQPSLDEGGVANINDRLGQVIAGQGGEVTTTELWGKRALAYPIRKYFEGHYVLRRYQMPSAGAEEVDRFLRYNEDVIRYLAVRSDDY